MARHPLSSAFKGLFFLTGLFFFNFTSRVIFSPLLPVIEKEMGIDHAQSGSFFLFISAGYFLSILSSGFISARINHQRTIVVSSIALGLALFTLGACSTLFTLQLGLFVLGLGAGLYFPSGLATISHLVDPAYLSRGMSIHELAPNLGFVAAPLICHIFLVFIPWRQGLAILGTLIIVSGIIYGFSSHGSKEKGTAPDLSAAKIFFRMPLFWGLVGLFSLAICSTLGIYAMAPLFLVNDHGMEPGKANSLLAFSRVASILMPLAGGWVGDRYGKQLVMALILLFTGLITAALAIVHSGIWVTVLVVVQPLLAVCFFPAGFAVLSKLGSAKYGNLGVSLCLPVAFLIGGGLMPTLIGVVGDLYSISTGFFLVGFLMAVGGGCSLFVTFRNDKKVIV
ncbi:MAG TPA: MFS transporter [Desulfocapsa sulfexigens]|nr:MFS transporter [Desulfocapsa sulfexigens]